MGATTFFTEAEGQSASEAFNRAVAKAQYEYGHGGYTGTIAEKSDFLVFKGAEGIPAMTLANVLLNDPDSKVRDKWGPAGCIERGEGKYLFFGWAPE